MERLSAEEKIIRAMRASEEDPFEDGEDSDEEEEAGLPFESPQSKNREKNRRRNKGVIENFLGNGRRAGVAIKIESYYFALCAWATGLHIRRAGWEIVQVLAYDSPSPLYSSIRTSDQTQEEEQILYDGQILIRKDGISLVVSIYRHMPFMEPAIYIEGAANRKEQVEAFAKAVQGIATNENFYRGKILELSSRLDIIDAGDRTWESVILPEEIKADIRANTIDFLGARDKWARFGIPLKRGVLLAGEPGTGKTAICKAMMKEAGEEITCIIANAYSMDDEYYISTLYEIAQDLIPAIVFIEDIDMIGEDREESHRMHRSSLISLLAELDGIEEQRGIVTVATTNSLEALDKALSNRPSRFDRVIKLELPSLAERCELVNRLCKMIPLGEHLQDYIARKSENCTPAQVEEIIRSLVIERVNDLPEDNAELLEFSTSDIDRAIRKINGRNGHSIGFTASNKSNGDYRKNQFQPPLSPAPGGF